MALTPQQQQQIIEAKQRGLSKEQTLALVFNQTARPTAPQNAFSDMGQDFVSTAQDIGSSLKQRVADTQETVKNPTPGGIATVGGNIPGAAGDIIGGLAVGAGKLFTTQKQEDAISKGVGEAVQKTGIPDAYNQLQPNTQKNIRQGSGFLDALGFGLAGKARNALVGKVDDVARTGNVPVTGVDDLGNVPIKPLTETEVVDTTSNFFKTKADDVNLTPSEREAAAKAGLTFSEKYIGMTPDIKKRLGEMGEEKLTEYLDAVHLRNIDDTAPTPYEVGADNVGLAETKLQEVLNDTGSGIGQTRQKLSTFRFSQPQVDAITQAFNNQLNRLKLTIKNGEVVQTKGTISGTETGDINALNSLYQDLLTFKQSPTLANGIDLRKNFDGKIKFGKSARDVSNEVDPLSRNVRKVIANEAAKVVGKENAALLKQYSDFMDAFGDLQSFTNRAAGGEYLLRLVLSGRGGEARKLIDTIKQYTGIDLMNDATAMKVATETLGNPATQNLFRQEVTNAGYDAAAVLSGSPTGIMQVVGKKLLDYGIDPETVLKAAAAGTGGYILMTYYGDDGIAPAGIAVLAAMPNKARKEAIKQAEDIAKSTGKTLKLSSVDKDLVANKLSSITQKNLEAKGSSGGATIDLDDIAELERLQKGLEAPKGLTNTDYIEARALLEKYDLSFNKGETPQTTPQNNLSGKVNEKVAPSPLLEEAKKYKSAEELGIDTSKQGHLLDQLKTLDIDSAKVDLGEFGKTIGFDERDLLKQTTGKLRSNYWLEKIKNGERPVVLVDLEKGKLAVIDGNHKLSAYKSLNIKEVPTVYTEKAKSQLEDIWNQANKPSLLEEAKGKTLDEFVKAQGTPMYHGSDIEIKEFNKSFGGETTGNNKLGTIFLTADKNLAKQYGIQASLAKNPNVSLNTPEGMMLEALAEKQAKVNQASVSLQNPKIIDLKGNSLDVNKSLKEQLKAIDEGFDGIIYKNATDDVRFNPDKKPTDIYAVFDPANIKTRTQLEDIWKQANK